jgi:hypothetical protein
MAPNFTDIHDQIIERRLEVLEAVRAELEPAAGRCMFDEIGPISMAISMKRIADFICGNPDREDIVAYLGRELDDWKKR